ncbi:MAG TPA: hybrid sensor histidine kinase/response regulator [Kofleriaceae bacterium]|nr:hybrid sensor histidine kinase/response regulator [Kofleriaceae bacterium]
MRLLDKHGFHAVECHAVDDVVRDLDDAGCALISSDTLTPAARDRIASELAKQPPWSDFPIIVFAPTGGGAEDVIEANRLLGNVTILERPVQIRTLISAVVAALRARRRQYEGRAAIRARDQFLAMLGHELRNPLAAILLALEMLHNASDRSSAKPRAIIDRQVRHLSRLVDDLLDVARVTSGKISLKQEPIDVGEVVRRCAQGAEMAARSRKIELTALTPDDDRLVVSGDLVRLEEVFTNLLGNAIKYSPEHARVRITAHRDGHTAVVDVEDTGIGIAPELLGKVFDLFAQADASLDRSQGGLGIGLTLVRSLVELHHGSVEAHSEGLGHGSRFTVRLPLAAARTEAEPAVVAAPEERPPLHVVLVEDNADLLEMTKDLLELQGCQVTAAHDGETGLSQILATPCDLALVDIGLPGLDGYQIASQLRATAASPPMLVAMTGYGQPEDGERALAAGFDAHLTKPVTIETLQRMLDRASGAASRGGARGTRARQS